MSRSGSIEANGQVFADIHLEVRASHVDYFYQKSKATKIGSMSMSWPIDI